MKGNFVYWIAPTCSAAAVEGHRGSLELNWETNWPVGFPLLVLKNGPPPHSVICRRGVGARGGWGGGSQTQI